MTRPAVHTRSVVTAKAQYNLKNAKGYFEKHLSVGDYYEEGQKISGEWFGQGGAMLGLSGRVGRDDFLALCDNLHPQTGETLTQRQRKTRKEEGREVADRRVFYDFTFSPPKSVSIVALVLDERRLMDAHERAVRMAMREFEGFAATRVRRGGSCQDRLTGNVVAALFTHDTSRALDPHLHTHCIVFNATHDPVEERWKALQNYEMLRARKYVENVYYHELARELRARGFEIRNRARGDFEVESISDELCARFSKRHEQIDDALKKLLEEKPELADGNFKDLRERLATAERSRKQPDLGRTELRRLWWEQITPNEREGLLRLGSQLVTQNNPTTKGDVGEAIAWAEEHLFDRHSVVSEHELWLAALGRMRGANVDVDAVKQFTKQRGYVRSEADQRELTQPSVLQREWEIVMAARDGMSAGDALVPSPQPLNEKLDEEQREALRRFLQSGDRVSVFRGGAGTGKSFVLGELVKAVQTTGRSVTVLAPQRQQVVELEKAGFPAPTTVTGFLLRAQIPPRSLVVVDEAGQIGGKQMHELLRLVDSAGGRLILSGDTRQHGPVEASDALVAIERYSGIKPVELHSIRRQDPRRAKNDEERTRIAAYRDAVAAAAAGQFEDSFAKLEAMGAVVSCGLGEQSERLADEYLRLVEEGASTVVVSQTWGEVHRVNERVRAGLKGRGLIAAEERNIPALEKLDLTNAQKRDTRFYSTESLVVFNQPVQGVEAGSTGTLFGVLKNSVLVEVAGRFVNIPNQRLDRVTVCRPVDVPVATGDRLHLKANRKLASGGRVTNGELVTVRGVSEDGTVVLEDGRLLDRSYREFLPGYAVTSYGSQGKTVDYVLFSDSTVKAATNSQQWYVTISRGRKGLRIITPDKDQLRENILRSGHRTLALDIAKPVGAQPTKRGWFGRLDGALRRFGNKAAKLMRRARLFTQFHQQRKESHEQQINRVLGQ